MLSSKKLIALHFTFRSIIHFQLLSVKGIKFVSEFIFVCLFVLHVDTQIFQHICLKRLSLLHCLSSFVKDQLTIFKWVNFWIVYSISLTHLSIFSPVLHYIDYCCFAVNFAAGSDRLLTLLFSFNIGLAILDLLPLHTTFRIVSGYP